MSLSVMLILKFKSLPDVLRVDGYCCAARIGHRDNNNGDNSDLQVPE